MSQPPLLSILESPTHRDRPALYRECGYEPASVNSMRKAIARVKRTAPTAIVAEFFYSYANDYAGVTTSNLDVLLYTLQKYAPDTRVIVLVSKADHPHVEALNAIFPIHATILQPASAAALREALTLI